jgi:hypothetical protein
MSVKQPLPNIPVPNPLHNYASYSYALSLWWLDITDYTALANTTDVDQALALEFPNSYVIAEDSGLYPDRRLPTTAGLNYYLSNVELTTHIQPTTTAGDSDQINCRFDITEPYGSTLVTSLVNYAVSQGIGNYLEQNLLLQIDFRGYDDTGAMITNNQTGLFRKRFPIRLATMKMKVSNAGTKYSCTATPSNFEVSMSTNCKLPKAMQVTAGTVKELLDGVADQYNQWYLDEVQLGHRQLADTLQFNIDPDIGSSKLIRPDTIPLSGTNPNATDTDLTKVPFNFTKDQDLFSIIHKAFAQCTFWVTDQLALGPPSPDAINNNLANILNTYKITYVATPGGLAGNGAEVTGADSQDIIRNKQAYAYGVNIHQYPTWGGPHPMDTGQLADTRPFTIKLYDYLYTGENLDVMKLDIDFNCRFYTSVIVDSNAINASQVTSDSANQNQAISTASSGFGLTPSALMNSVLPQLKNTPILSPVRIHSILNDASVSNGLRGQSDAIIAADVLEAKRAAQGTDLLTAKIEIVGDPTLLKQDNWLYTPDPTVADSNYNGWDTMNNYDFALKYGHLRMDAGQLVIGLQINTPLDIDTDYLNDGLVYPPMTRNGTASSIFSGQYNVLTIKSVFDKGQFKQELSLSRYFNQELVNQTPVSTTGSTTTSQANQRESNTTNGTSTSSNTSTPSTVAQTSGATILNTPVAPITILPATPVLNTNAVPNGVQARQ